MDAKSIATLEFPKVIERLAGLCGSPGGRELALELDAVERCGRGAATFGGDLGGAVAGADQAAFFLGPGA